MGLFDFLFEKSGPKDGGGSSFDGFGGCDAIGHEDFCSSLDNGFGGGKDGSDFGGSFITYDNSYFKNNDEDRAICEDMFGDRAMNHDIDLEYHYGWENKLNYDTDGYEDEEDW